VVKKRQARFGATAGVPTVSDATTEVATGLDLSKRRGETESSAPKAAPKATNKRGHVDASSTELAGPQHALGSFVVRVDNKHGTRAW
jgi:hypothetical protein